MLGSLLGSVNINSHDNQNPNPPFSIFPQRYPSEPGYSIQESKLRSALFIPKAFGFGKNGKKPVLLVPGTGSYGGEAFAGNFAKLLKNSTWGDPVWLNVPGRMCDEAPKNAEYVAYAIHYLSAVTSKSIAVVAWSQGNLSVQWVLKYWDTTRNVVDNFIALSADFHGTTTAYIAAPLPGVPCTPSVWNQRYDANFIRTLRADNGDSAYVPTTSVYSMTDEVVQPQTGLLASAYMKDVRLVGVTNCEVQAIAPLRLAGGIFTHETLLINPLAWALAEDAITHGRGQGRLDRISVNSVSLLPFARGLNPLIDVVQTQALTLSCGAAIAAYFPKPIMEPAMPLYATIYNKIAKSDIPTVEAAKVPSVSVAEVPVTDVV